jgi:RNA polymerase sigma factor for flagellar operon FliA
MLFSNDDPRLQAALRMTRALVLRMSRRLPSSVPVDDLVAAGYLGVAKAVSRYPGEQSGSFESFALVHARGAVLDELRQRDPLTRRERARARRAATAIRTLGNALGREPAAEEVAREMGIALEAYRTLQDRLNQTAVAATTGDRALSEEEVVVVDTAEPADEQLHGRRMHALIASEIAKLPPRLALTLTASFEDGHSLGVIARQMGVTEARVWQIRKEALGILKRACKRSEIPTLAEVG